MKSIQICLSSQPIPQLRMNFLLRLPPIVLLTACAALPFMLSASPLLAPHMQTLFSGTGSRPYHDRLPWAVKHRPNFDWMKEFGEAQASRRKFFLKGYESIETLKQLREELKKKNRKNSNRVENLIEYGNREVPSWVLRKYR